MNRISKPVVVAATTAILIIGCAKDDDSNGSGGRTAAEALAAGWDAFETGDYATAHSNFTEATGLDSRLSDAYNGLGWSSGRMPGRLSEAGTHFGRSLGLDTTRYDALGGWAFAVYQSGDYAAAIAKADSLLRRRPGWRFLHQQTIDFRDVKLMMAAAWYQTGNYSASYAVVQELNPAFEADVRTPSGRRELMEEIERLRRIYG
ncbi:MAG: hypothetical protein FJY67_10880 [Calditrichaeota bacterium]|nr:hypothetical protein [Calditrichota bacterium]